MADEKQYRNFAQERGQERQSAREGAGRDSGSAHSRSHDVDPLAELARLIGQTDPFSDKRDPRTAPAARASVRPAPEAPPRHATPSRSYDDYGDDAPQPDSYEHQAEQNRNREQAPARPVQQRVAYPAAPPAAPTYQPAYAPAPAYGETESEEAYAQYAAAYDEPQGSAFPHPHHGGPDADGYYGDADYAADEGAAPVYPRRSRKLLAGVAVGALVLLGVAGAFGYRAITGHLQHSGPPPVIKAETAPAKVAPAQPAGEQQGKMIYSRLGSDGKDKDERIVSREEKPVDIKPAGGDPGNGSAPPAESSLPPGPVTSQAPLSTSGGIGAQATPQSPTLGRAPNLGPSGAAPRKVHTVTIRPNEPFTPPAPAPTTGPRSEAQPSEQVASAGAGAATPPWPPQRATQTSEGQPRQVRTQPVHANNSPLSLTSEANAAPDRTASTGSIPAGSYAVQLASHRTEAEARTTFHRLQGKFPSLLGDRQLIIRKADLGAKGVYYRAMVGPFATAGEATGFCGNLKSSGGQCVVQRN